MSLLIAAIACAGFRSFGHGGRKVRCGSGFEARRHGKASQCGTSGNRHATELRHTREQFLHYGVAALIGTPFIHARSGLSVDGVCRSGHVQHDTDLIRADASQRYRDARSKLYRPVYRGEQAMTRCALSGSDQ
jgi:hypothetical protein